MIISKVTIKTKKIRLSAIEAKSLIKNYNRKKNLNPQEP